MRISDCSSDVCSSDLVPGVQINRFCASGLEAVNMAAAKVYSGEAGLAIGGGVESMSRVPMASDGGAWAMDQAVAYKTYFAPPGIGADAIGSASCRERVGSDGEYQEGGASLKKNKGK